MWQTGALTPRAEATLPMVLALLLAIPWQVVTAAPSENPCSAAEARLDAGPFQTWHNSFAYFDRFKGACSDGALAESLSAYHTILLSQRGQFAVLKSLTRNRPDYLAWVLRGVFYDPDEAEGPATTACRLRTLYHSCPSPDQALCAAIASRIGPSAEYMHACEVR